MLDAPAFSEFSEFVKDKGPLSVISCLGMPYLARWAFSFLMTVEDLVLNRRSIFQKLDL